jgi:hypothetical protein
MFFFQAILFSFELVYWSLTPHITGKRKVQSEAAQISFDRVHVIVIFELLGHSAIFL